MWAAAWVVAASAVALHHVAPLPSAYAAAGTTTTRRMALHKAAAAAALGFGFRPSATAEARVPLARAQIEAKLAKVPVVALVNADDAPYLDGAGVGYFYLDPTEALLSLKLLQKNSPDARLKVVTLTEVYFPLVRGEQPNLGGVLRVRPSRREVVLANRALAFQQRENALLPTSLDEAKGQVHASAYPLPDARAHSRSGPHARARPPVTPAPTITLRCRFSTPSALRTSPKAVNRPSPSS